MLKKACVFTTAALAVFAYTAPAAAQQQDTVKERLQREIDALSQEIEQLKLGEDVVVRADTSQHGMGPAASKVYRANEGFSIGGYGEFLFQNFAEKRENDVVANARSTADALRVITYFGYKFAPKLLFNSEIEYEHANTEVGGEVEVEFAYLDYEANPAFGVRAGLLLVPMGFINELHEPPVYLGSQRPASESAIIPTTWAENGAGIYGDYAGLSYRAYVVAGFDAAGSGGRTSGFSATGLRGGRQHGGRSLAENAGLVARVDYTPTSLPSVLLGASAYTGNSGQGAKTSAGVPIEAGTTIVEAHVQLRYSGFELRGLYTRATVDDVPLINAARNLTGSASVGEKLAGWYAQGGYDLLRLTKSQMQLMPYVRYEKVNTQKQVPAGFTASPANDRTITTVGAQLKPIANIVVKADYQIQKNEAKTGLNQFNIALGYLF